MAIIQVNFLFANVETNCTHSSRPSFRQGAILHWAYE